MRASNQLMILCSTHTITQSFAADTAIQGRTLGPINWLNYWWSAGPRQSMLAIWAQMERGTITVIVNTRLGAIRPRIRSAPHNLIANALPGLDAMQCMAIS